MLNVVPSAINSLSRKVIMNHPNAWSGFVLKKKMTDKAVTDLGGLGVMSNEDDDEYTYELAGECYIVIVNDGMSQSIMNESREHTGYDAPDFRFLIEPEPELLAADRFSVEKGDLVFIVVGTDVQNSPRPAYEVVDIETVNNIPPFSQRYIMQRRSDFDIGL